MVELIVAIASWCALHQNMYGPYREQYECRKRLIACVEKERFKTAYSDRAIWECFKKEKS